jgi:hypothetical protein
MRKWRRLVAHNRMKKAGMTDVNDHKYDDSFFSKHWRDYA